MQGLQYIGAVNLARLTDTPSMLPVAMYRCSYLGGRLLDGWTRKDGTVEHLSDEDARRCVNARRELGRQEILLVTRVFDALPRERCKNRGRCAPVIARIAHHVIHENTLPVVEALWDWSKVIEGLGGMCEGCMQALYERDKAERRRIWDALPDILDITVQGWGQSDSGEGVENAA